MANHPSSSSKNSLPLASFSLLKHVLNENMELDTQMDKIKSFKPMHLLSLTMMHMNIMYFQMVIITWICSPFLVIKYFLLGGKYDFLLLDSPDSLIDKEICTS